MFDEQDNEVGLTVTLPATELDNYFEGPLTAQIRCIIRYSWCNQCIFMHRVPQVRILPLFSKIFFILLSSKEVLQKVILI